MPPTLFSSNRANIHQRSADYDDQPRRRSPPSPHTTSKTVIPPVKQSAPQGVRTPSVEPQPKPVSKNGTKEAEKAEKLEKSESEPTEDDEADSDAIIDQEIFDQILDLDDDDTHEFSKNMVFAYFTQAESTFEDMGAYLKTRDLAKLSDLGHFLKGSSAALGITKVQSACEKIQHYGNKRDEEAGENITAEEAEDRIRKLVPLAKKEYAVAEKWLKKWFEENSTEEAPS